MGFTIDESVKRIPAYPRSLKYGHMEGTVQLSANENPYPPSPNVISAIMESLLFLNRYPDGDSELKELIAAHLGVKPENVALGCGSDEIIEIVFKISVRPDRKKVLIPNPSFPFYGIAARIYGYDPVYVPLRDFHIDVERIKDSIDDETRIIFLSNPNNPTGTLIGKRDFEYLIESLPPDVLLVVDEAYYEFVESKNFPISFLYLDRAPVITLRTFSKAYGLAGLRIGFAVSEPGIVGLIERARQPFSVNSVAIAAAKAALKDRLYTSKIVKSILTQKRSLYKSLEDLGLEFIRSESNFVLVRLGSEAENIVRKLSEQKIIIRWMGPLGLPEYVRVTVGKKEENEIFVEALRRILQGG